MVKVRFVGYGILVDEENFQYACDVDGRGNVESLETGELFRISKRDANDYPVELMPL